LITRVAIPYIAILTLSASDSAVAWLNMAEVFAGIVGGLFLGTCVDRASRKHLLITADLARAVLLVAIPLAWWYGQLTVALLAGVAFSEGLNTHLFRAAYNAYLPSAVPKHELLKSNAKVRGSAAIAEAGSFSLGGVIVGLLGAPIAILIDVASYLVSALLISRVPNVAARNAAVSTLSWAHTTKAFLNETRIGMRWVNAHRSLRSLLICAASMACWDQMIGVVYMLFVARDLALSPSLLGVLFAVGGASSLVSVIIVTKLSHRIRYGQVLIYGMLATLVGLVCLVLAPTSNLWLAAVAIVLQQLILDAGLTAFSLVEQTCKQTLAPNEYLGRVNGVAQWSRSLAQVGGGVAAALIVGSVGSRGVLWIALLGMAMSILYTRWSRLHELQVSANEQEHTA
ncbi:MAG: MFS transporter, partial [Gammaproteobacteria bacterium]